MSDQALKDAKLKTLETENAQLQQVVRNLAAECRSRKQACDELFNANVQLRSVQLLLEEDIQRFQKEYLMMAERCTDLQKKIDELEAETAATKAA